jgi:hypothetical protein
VGWAVYRELMVCECFMPFRLFVYFFCSYHKSQLKLQLIEALKDRIDGIIRGVIQFNEVEIISPLKKK